MSDQAAFKIALDVVAKLDKLDKEFVNFGNRIEKIMNNAVSRAFAKPKTTSFKPIVDQAQRSVEKINRSFGDLSIEKSLKTQYTKARKIFEDLIKLQEKLVRPKGISGRAISNQERDLRIAVEKNKNAVDAYITTLKKKILTENKATASEVKAKASTKKLKNEIARLNQEVKKLKDDITKLNQKVKASHKPAEDFDNIITKWWKTFGRVAIGFTVAYRAMNAFEKSISTTIDLVKEAIIDSGELSALQGELATYYMISGGSIENYNKYLERAVVNVEALRLVSLHSMATIEELSVAYSELAQHGVFIQPEEMNRFAAVNDGLIQIAKSTGDNVKQIRSEWQGLLDGQMKATNAFVRFLKTSGVITKEQVKQLKGLGNKGAIVRGILESAGDAFLKMQETMLRSKPEAALAKWRDALKSGILLAIQDVSKDKGLQGTNIFAEILVDHIENLNKLFSDRTARSAFKDGIDAIASSLDKVLTMMEGFIINTVKFSSWLAQNSEQLIKWGKVLGTIILYKSVAGVLVDIGTKVRLLTTELTTSGKTIRSLMTGYVGIAALGAIIAASLGSAYASLKLLADLELLPDKIDRVKDKLKGLNKIIADEESKTPSDVYGIKISSELVKLKTLKEETIKTLNELQARYDKAAKKDPMANAIEGITKPLEASWKAIKTILDKMLPDLKLSFADFDKTVNDALTDTMGKTSWKNVLEGELKAATKFYDDFIQIVKEGNIEKYEIYKYYAQQELKDQIKVQQDKLKVATDAMYDLLKVTDSLAILKPASSVFEATDLDIFVENADDVKILDIAITNLIKTIGELQDKLNKVDASILETEINKLSDDLNTELLNVKISYAFDTEGFEKESDKILEIYRDKIKAIIANNKTLTDGETKAIVEFLDKVDAAIKKVTETEKERIKLIDDYLNKKSEFSFADDDLSQTANLVKGVQNITDAWEKQAEVLKAIKEQYGEITKGAVLSAEEKKKALEGATKAAEVNEKALSTQLAGYSNLADVMSNYFKKGSEGRKRLHQLEVAFGAIELAMEAKKMATKIADTAISIDLELSKMPTLAANAILTQGAGDPLTAFARMAAMTALVGGIIAAAGGAFGGGGGGHTSHAAITGTVLGSDESSKSLENTIDMLEEFRDANIAKLDSIYKEMQDLNTNISGLANSIVRNIGDIPIAKMGEPYERFVPVFGVFVSKIWHAVGDVASWAANAVFGGRKRITAQGISIKESTIADILETQAVDTRAYYITKTHGGLLGHTRRTPHYRDLDENTTDLLNKLYVSMSTSLVTLAEDLGTSVQDALDYSFEEVKLNFRKLSGEEIQTKLSAFISTTMDKATDEIFGKFLRKYQKIDEGLMETGYRLITTKEVLLSVFEDTGQAFELATASINESNLVGLFSGGIVKLLTVVKKNIFDFTQAIADSFGGLKEAYDAISNYADKFLTESEKQQNVIKHLTDVFDNDTMTSLNLALPQTRDEFKKLVKSLDITTESGLAAYTTLIKATDLADSYYSILEENREKAQDIVKTTADMAYELSLASGEISQYEQNILNIHKKSDAYYDSLVDNGVSLEEATAKTTEWAAAMSELTKQEMINNTTRNLTIQLLQAQGETEKALTMQREDEINALRDTFGDLADPMIEIQREIWNLQDASEVAASAMKRLANVMSDFSIASKVADISGLSDQFQLQQVALNLGWLESGIPSISDIRDFVEGVLSSSVSEIREQAVSFGMSTSDYLDNIGFLYSGLQKMDEAIAQAGDTSKRAAAALRDYADNLKSQISAVESIQDLLNNIRGEGNLAPVQSMEYFENRYAQLRSEAMSGGERETKIFTDFTTKYLEFAQNYGGDYQSVTDMVIGDLEDLQTSIAGDKTLADLYDQLERVNARLDAVSHNTYATATGIADAIGKTMEALLEGFKDQSLPWEDWMKETRQDFYGILDSFRNVMATGILNIGKGFEAGKGWLGEGSGIDIIELATGAYQASIYGEGGDKLYDMIFENVQAITSSLLWRMMEQTPEIMTKWTEAPQHHFASGTDSAPGGLAWVNEEGPELLNLPQGTQVTSHSDTIKMITDAVGNAIENTAPGGQKITVLVNVKMGTKEFKDFTAETIRVDKETQKQIRRVAANG